MVEPRTKFDAGFQIIVLDLDLLDSFSDQTISFSDRAGQETIGLRWVRNC